jgi:hypothetical protein
MSSSPSRFCYKSPFIADNYSRRIPGSGHFYLGRYLSGFGWFCLWIIALVPYVLPGLLIRRLCGYACVATRRSKLLTTMALLIGAGCLIGDLHIYQQFQQPAPFPGFLPAIREVQLHLVRSALGASLTRLIAVLIAATVTIRFILRRFTTLALIVIALLMLAALFRAHQ